MPRFRKLIGIGRNIHEVIREKSDMMSKPIKNRKYLEHSERSGIAIRHGQMMIDDQDAFFSWLGAVEGNEIAVFRLGSTSTSLPRSG